MLLAAGLLYSAPSQAVELSWDEGVSRIRASIEVRDYRRARDTLVILLRDHPSQDAVFTLDLRFSVGETGDAALLLSRIAQEDLAALFDARRSRATQWDTFKVQLDELETYVARNPVDNQARLVLGYYLLLSGMPMRGERILDRIHSGCPEWGIAQLLLEASRGRSGHSHSGGGRVVVYPPTPPQPPEPSAVVVVKIVRGGVPAPQPPSIVDAPRRERPRLSARAGFGSLLLPGGVITPVSRAALGLKTNQGISYELQLGASGKALIPQGDTRKEVSLNTAGFGISYSGPVADRVRLQPVVGLGAEVLAASPLAAQASFAVGLTGRLGLDLAIPVRQGELRLGVEGTASRPVSQDENFPTDLPLLVNATGTLGITF
jgi:hypothetical protein